MLANASIENTTTLQGMPLCAALDDFRLNSRLPQLAAREKSLILATIEVANVQGLFEEFKARQVEFPQTLAKQAWGGTDFYTRDPTATPAP